MISSQIWKLIGIFKTTISPFAKIGLAEIWNFEKNPWRIFKFTMEH